MEEPPADPKPASVDGLSGRNVGVQPRTPGAIPSGEYEVKRGDALAKIARKAEISVDQLKAFNALADDRIRSGQTLLIPTQVEVLAMPPPPPPPPPVAKVVPEKSKKRGKAVEQAPLPSAADLEAEATLIQVFLDRENFSSGPIDGNTGAVFEHVLSLYHGIHPELTDPAALREKALAVVEHPFTSYRLARSDFRFIQTPKVPAKPPISKGKKPAPPVAPTYEEMIAETFSAYGTAWEFVAEKFHCDEAFLRSLNPKIKEPPAVGAEFKVPNVIPFEVEKCFAESAQPAADPAKPVTAAIIGLSRLEIRQSGQLVAVMPVSRTKPDLRGRGTWTILKSIPGPELATRQELSSTPKTADPIAPIPPPTAEQFLAAGPRNPVGVFWIDLAKANSSEALPYGLHGTAIPSRMKTYESIGGFRMANWDIARAVRMLPEGTPLQWK